MTRRAVQRRKPWKDSWERVKIPKQQFVLSLISWLGSRTMWLKGTDMDRHLPHGEWRALVFFQAQCLQAQETRDHSLAEFLTVSSVSQKRTVGCPFPNGKRKKTRRFVRTGKPCKDFCCCCRKAGETQKNWKGDRLKDSSRLWRLRLPFQMQSILKFLLKIHTGESFYATVRGKLSDNIPNSILYWASRKDFHIF